MKDTREIKKASRIWRSRSFCILATTLILWVWGDIAQPQATSCQVGTYDCSGQLYLYNGNVGVGVTAPGEKLQVQGNMAISGKMTAGIVPLARVGASVDVAIPSTANGTNSSTVIITHGLGTDDVTVIVRGSNTHVYGHVLLWRFPDGYIGTYERLGTTLAHVPISPPPSGQIYFIWRNDTGGTASPTFKVDILRRS